MVPKQPKGGYMALVRKTGRIRKNMKEDKRREQFKKAAIDIFSQKGYEQATIKDMAAQAGVSRSLLYWYWESKADLLSDLIEGYMERYVDLIRRAVGSSEPFPKKFYNLLWNGLELYGKSEKLSRLVHLCALRPPSKPGDVDFAAQIGGYYKKILELLESLFQDGADTGHLDKNMDAEAMAMGMISIIEGYIHMSVMEKRMPLDRILHLTLNMARDYKPGP